MAKETVKKSFFSKVLMMRKKLHKLLHFMENSARATQESHRRPEHRCGQKQPAAMLTVSGKKWLLVRLLLDLDGDCYLGFSLLMLNFIPHSSSFFMPP